MPLHNLLKKFKRKNNRSEVRVQALPNLVCSVTPLNSNKKTKVMVIDLSKNGLSFLVTGAAFDVGEAVLLDTSTRSSQVHWLEGKIVGQQVSYLPNSDDVDKAFFRYSVQFDIPLVGEQWEELGMTLPP